MHYPDAIDAALVGEHTMIAHEGGGHFFDQVLEYRVWFHCAPDAADDQDEVEEGYYYAFATYAEALACSTTRPGAGKPRVLVRQLEWVEETPDAGLVHCKGERITEWKPKWLAVGVRQPGAIEAFIAERTRQS